MIAKRWGAKVKSEGTLPERRVRRALLDLGVSRFEMNAKDLPGTPDIVIRGLRKVILVHGCFWHVHSGCRGMRIPHVEVRKAFWYGKLARNVLRDRQDIEQLEALGWEVFTVWECECGDGAELRRRLHAFLQGRAGVWG